MPYNPTLIEVLRALDQFVLVPGIPIKSQLQLVQVKYGEIVAHWDLRYPHLLDQSDDTKKWVNELLATL